VIDFVRSGLSRGLKLEKISEALLDECCSKDPSLTAGKGTDNETCVIIKLNNRASKSDTPAE
jgi:serine/threonine protein phosphatase PrpC